MSTLVLQWFCRNLSELISGMMTAWLPHANAAGWRRHTPSLGSVCRRRYRVSSVIREHASLRSSGGKKTLCGICGKRHGSGYDRARRRIRDLSCGEFHIYLDVEVRRLYCRQCRVVKRERLALLGENAHHTARFARYVGWRCAKGTIKDIAKELRLSWHTVKELDKQYMREQLKRANPPNPKVIGIDEISIRKGRDYRIVVSDLERRRPIWFGGKDRSEESMDEFYRFLGEKKAKKIRLAVMDMWKAFHNSTTRHAPQAAILYDKFHVINHLGKAIDKTRTEEYARLKGKHRKFIKGQKYALLSHRQNLTGTARKNLKLPLSGNQRLNIAYLLKESFGQLWDYRSETWARKFFENWCGQLKRQRLKHYEKLAEMIDSHWDGIAAYCRPENKIALGFVEGLNNKIRVIQRRAYGLRDEEYFRLKVLTCTLPLH